ncbi:MAG: hypothetical protein KBD78_06095 [Oligoflexales bacterium]|nr:hypothetical protein [Oligoflexales bacterium]
MKISQSIIISFFILQFSSSVLASEPVELNQEELDQIADTPGVPKKNEQTRIFSCSIEFPLNSVQFDTKLVDECFKGIVLERVSYVHVIATATTTGTSDHNLFLSTRRAGSIEGYIKNKYPQMQVHAFGGGANPKFGKSARIIIVESAPNAEQEADGLSSVIVKAPEVKIKIQKEYILPKKFGYDVNLMTGLAEYQEDGAMYQLVNVRVYRPTKFPLLKEVDLGVGYGLNRSNNNLDIQTMSVLLGKMYRVYDLANFHKFDLGADFFAGTSAIQDQSEMDYGFTAKLRYGYESISASLHINASKHFNSVTLGGGVLL